MMIEVTAQQADLLQDALERIEKSFKNRKWYWHDKAEKAFFYVEDESCRTCEAFFDEKLRQVAELQDLISEAQEK